MTSISVRTEPLIRHLRMARGLCCCISPSLIVEIPGMNLGLFGAYGGTTIGCRESLGTIPARFVFENRIEV